MLSRHYFDLWSTPIYERPYVFFIASLLLRFVQLFFVFLISLEVCRDRRYALTALALFSFSLGVFRWPQNGLIGPPIFLAAGVATCISLAGLLLMLRKSWILAGISIGLAPYFHMLYGLSVIPAFALAALLWATSRHDRQSLLEVGIFLIVMLATILPVAATKGLEIVGTNLTHQAWFHFLTIRDPEDVFVLYSISPFWPFHHCCHDVLFIPKKDCHSVVPGLLADCFRAFFTACAVFESIEFKGIFLGTVSEIYTAIEFRRALWLMAVCVVPVVVRELSRRPLVSEWSLFDFILLGAFIHVIQVKLKPRMCLLYS